MFPPKYAKPNGSHHEKVEGVSVNLLAVQWPTQGRSYEKHRGSHSQWETPKPMLSSKWNEPFKVAHQKNPQPPVHAMCWGCMERLNSSTQVVSLSIYGMYGVASDLGLKFHGLQEWPKLPHQTIQPWSASSKKSSSPNGSSHMKKRDVVWQSWFSHCFSWNIQHIK